MSCRYQRPGDEEPLDPWKITYVYRYMDGDWFSVQEYWSEVKQPLNLNRDMGFCRDLFLPAGLLPASLRLVRVMEMKWNLR